ncbi:alcohol dehydrogenase catalytic domain-containing protein [Streptomyces sp. NBC_00286]|uniref:alcohol dehydrogenase catalytic domain-containing protein n=1 Tax=Streptomyces sp. NBC_00286 TaxID=2975701 RepID=UPI003FA6ADF2
MRITTSAICGTDLLFVPGTMSGLREGRILGHEAVGVVVDVGCGSSWSTVWRTGWMWPATGTPRPSTSTPKTPSRRCAN